MEFLRNIKAPLIYQVRKTLIWLNIRRRFPHIKVIPKKDLRKYANNQRMCAAIVETIEAEMDIDDTANYKRGYSLLRAYQLRNPDLMLLALTGLTLEDILSKCKVLDNPLTTKDEYIERINEIINQYGTFSDNDVTDEKIRLVGNGGEEVLVAYFDYDKAVTNKSIKRKEERQYSDYLSYDELDMETLKIIFLLALKWKAYNED